MTNHGDILRKIRKSRGLSQDDLTNNIVSRQAISRFERGESEPNYNTFYEMVRQAGATLEEFQYEINTSKLDSYDNILFLIKKLHHEGDVTGLKKLMEKEEKKINNHPLQQLTCLMIKHLIYQLDGKTDLVDEEKEQIINYLYRISHWGYYELVLFGNTIGIFDAITLVNFTEDLITRSEHYQNIPNNKNLMVMTSLNLLSELVYYDEFDVAIKLKRRIEKLLEDDYFFSRTILLYNTGMLELSMGLDSESAKQKMRDAIMVIRIASSKRMADFYQQNYDETIRDLENNKTLYRVIKK